MAYLRSRIVNLLNLHYGIQALASNAGGVFVIVYLLKAGVSVPVALSAWSLIMAGRFAIRPLVLVLGKRTGIKPLVVFGTVATASQYLILPLVHGAGPALLGLCFAGAVSDVFYWTSYHAYFAVLGDDEHRGHQTSARESFASLIGIGAPVLGGWALAAFGARAAFGAVAFVQVLSALPLLATPNVAVPHAAPGAFRAARLGVILFAADGWISAGYAVAWQIALFLSLKESFTAYGGATGLAALFGAAAGLVLGRQVDVGRGVRAVWIAFAAFLVVAVARAASLGMPALAVVANALGAPVACLYTPVMLAPVYNTAKSAPCTLRFHVAAEGGADVGFGLGAALVAAMTAVGLPLSLAILTSLAGAAVSLAVLRNYYSRLENTGISGKLETAT